MSGADACPAASPTSCHVMLHGHQEPARTYEPMLCLWHKWELKFSATFASSPRPLEIEAVIPGLCVAMP